MDRLVAGGGDRLRRGVLHPAAPRHHRPRGTGALPRGFPARRRCRTPDAAVVDGAIRNATPDRLRAERSSDGPQRDHDASAVGRWHRHDLGGLSGQAPRRRARHAPIRHGDARRGTRAGKERWRHVRMHPARRRGTADGVPRSRPAQRLAGGRGRSLDRRRHGRHDSPRGRSRTRPQLHVRHRLPRRAANHVRNRSRATRGRPPWQDGGDRGAPCSDDTRHRPGDE